MQFDLRERTAGAWSKNNLTKCGLVCGVPMCAGSLLPCGGRERRGKSPKGIYNAQARILLVILTWEGCRLDLEAGASMGSLRPCTLAE